MTDEEKRRSNEAAEFVRSYYEMKTVLIYDLCGQEKIEFYVLDGDYQHLGGLYIGSCGNDDNEQELIKLMYSDDGAKLLTPEKEFPCAAVIAGAKVIVAGFLP